jgi:hypothetical protein
MFEDLTNMKVFDSSSNNISQFPESLFENMEDIKTINLSNNAIEKIETNSFQGLKKFSNLDLSFNALDRDNFLWPIVGLKYLNLSHNSYKQINVSVLDNLDVAIVHTNPFSCEWLVNEMKFAPNHIKFGVDFTTHSKENALRLPGIQCFERDGTKNKIIVMETEKEVEDRPDGVRSTKFSKKEINNKL